MRICVCNRKGGTSKSSISVALWSWLPKALAIDLDSQADLTKISGADVDSESNIYTVLMGETRPESAIQHTSMGDIIASAPELDSINELPFVTLANSLKSIIGNYQHLVIDCPPALNAAVCNALTLAETVIIPILASSSSLDGAENLAELIKTIRQDENPNLKIGGLLLTRFSSRPLLNRKMCELAEEVANKLGTRLFKARIRESVLVREAQEFHESLFKYAPKAAVANDYKAFMQEFEEVILNG